MTSDDGAIVTAWSYPTNPSSLAQDAANVLSQINRDLPTRKASHPMTSSYALASGRERPLLQVGIGLASGKREGYATPRQGEAFGSLMLSANQGRSSHNESGEV
jgi:hypothetical protein